MIGEDEYAEEVSAWPSFVDLLAATVMLLLGLLAVVIVVVTPGDPGTLNTWRSNLIVSLESQPGYSKVFEVDTSDALWVGVVLRAEATFPVGRFEFSQLTATGRGALEDVATALKGDSVERLIREVRIIGHTDATPFRDVTNSFSNWELSASRAAAVARYLVTEQGINPCLISAVGKGSHFPFRAAGEARLAQKDRRIEIQIVPDVRSGLPEQRAPCDAVGDGTARTSGDAASLRRIRGVVAEIDSLGETDRLIKEEVVRCGGGDSLMVENFAGELGELRKVVVRSRGASEEYVASYFYSADGDLVFLLSRHTAENGTTAEIRRYFNNDGTITRQDVTQPSDPGRPWEVIQPVAVANEWRKNPCSTARGQ